MACRCAPVNTVDWSAFTDGVVLHAHKAPPDVMEFAVRQAVIEFAQTSLSIQRDVYIDAQACVQDYEICLDDNYVVHSVRSVCVEGCDLTARTEPVCDHIPSNQFYFENPDQLLVGRSPAEDKPGSIVVRTVVHPSPDSCSVDRWVYDRHSEAIAAGALSRLLLMKDSQWYSQREAAIHLRRWKTFKNRIKGAQAKNHIAGPVYMRTRRFV